MTKRTKKKIVTPPAKSELTDIMKQFAEASSHIKALEAEEELQMLALRKAFEEKSRDLIEQRQTAIEKLEAFGLQNRDELFSEKRSMELMHGVIGFRTGTPKVSKPRATTWNKVIEALSENQSEFLRTKKEVDKDKILANRTNQELMSQLNQLGIQVVQEETFFISLKESDFQPMSLALA